MTFCHQLGLGRPCMQCKKQQVECPLLEGQMQGRKQKVVPGLGEERVARPSTKWARVASPRHGESTDIRDKWRQWVVDALEIANMK